jgi:DNA primase
LSVEEKLSFLKGIFGQDKQFFSSSKEFQVKCPFCVNHHKDKLSINVETGVYKCWVCDATGNTYLLLRDKLKANGSTLKKYATLYKFRSKKQKEDSEVFVLELPKEYEPLVSLKNSLASQRIFNYLKTRSVTEEYILRYKLGFCFSGNYQNRIIVPSFSTTGELNFFTGRTIYEKILPYLNPTLPPNYKNNIVINELNLDFSKKLYIVEGFFDLFKCPENTLPLCGSSLNTQSLLFRKLNENGTEVVLALDPDAKKKTLEIAIEMVDYGLDVSLVELGKNKDPGKMNPEEVLEIFNNAKKYTKTELLRKKIQMLLEKR